MLEGLAASNNDLAHIDAGYRMLQACDYEGALCAFDTALSIRESPQARWNRAQTLLCLGRYQEGFVDNDVRWKLFPTMLIESGKKIQDLVPRWLHQKLPGKRIVLMHEQGLGDSVLLLRYIPMLRIAGAHVTLEMPPELQRFAFRFAPPSDRYENICAPMYDLPQRFRTTLETVPGVAWMQPDPTWVTEWRTKLTGTRKKIGIAWCSKARAGDRSIPLDQFLGLLKAPDDCEVISLQTDEREQAWAAGITVPTIKDVADVAAIAVLCDAIVSIDTLALNVAGAIGHPTVMGLVPYNQNWKWHNGNPWYTSIKVCRQKKAGDWQSAFAQI